MPGWCADSRVRWARGGGSHTHYCHLLVAQLHPEVQEKDPFPPLCMLKTGQVPFEYLEDLLFC